MYAIRMSYPEGYDRYSYTILAVATSVYELERIWKEGKDNAFRGTRLDGEKSRLGYGVDIVELPDGLFDLASCKSIEILALN